jgi:hypothetical protein
MSGERESLLNLGFCEYIPKPIRTKVFEETIQKILQ